MALIGFTIVIGNIFQPIYAGEIQGPSLGIEIDIFNQQGTTLLNNEK